MEPLADIIDGMRWHRVLGNCRGKQLCCFRRDSRTAATSFSSTTFTSTFTSTYTATTFTATPLASTTESTPQPASKPATSKSTARCSDN